MIIHLSMANPIDLLTHFREALRLMHHGWACEHVGGAPRRAWACIRAAL